MDSALFLVKELLRYSGLPVYNKSSPQSGLAGAKSLQSLNEYVLECLK